MTEKLQSLKKRRPHLLFSMTESTPDWQIPRIGKFTMENGGFTALGGAEIKQFKLVTVNGVVEQYALKLSVDKTDEFKVEIAFNQLTLIQC